MLKEILNDTDPIFFTLSHGSTFENRSISVPKTPIITWKADILPSSPMEKNYPVIYVKYFYTRIIDVTLSVP